MDFSQFIPNIIESMQKYWHLFLLEGLKNTLILTCISVAMGTVFGALVALLRMSKLWVLRFLSSLYIVVIRGTPILLQLYIFYFVLPSILPFLKLSQFMWVSIALCVNSAAYVSEVIRSGIQAVDKGQTEAARSLGLSEGQTMLKIILPQAVKYILPAIGNELIALLKETSVAGYVAVVDVTKAATNIRNKTYDAVNPILLLALVYLVMVVALTRLLAVLERRLGKSDGK